MVKHRKCYVVRNVDNDQVLGIFDDKDILLDTLIGIIGSSDDLTSIINEYYDSNGLDVPEDEDYQSMNEQTEDWVRDCLKYDLYSFDYEYYTIEAYFLNQFLV
jgi:hypothetical protein